MNFRLKVLSLNIFCLLILTVGHTQKANTIPFPTSHYKVTQNPSPGVLLRLGPSDEDTSAFVESCKLSYHLKYQMPIGYEDLIIIGPRISMYKYNSCITTSLYKRIRDKKNDFIVGISYQPALGIETVIKAKKWYGQDMDINKNYLGGRMCKAERDSGWIEIFSKADFAKMNADTALCFRGQQNSFRPYLGKYDCRIAVLMHKDDRGDITVQFLYRKENELEVLKQVKTVWEIISYEYAN